MHKRTTVKISKVIMLAVVLLFCAAIVKLGYIVLSDKVDGVNLKEKALSITTVHQTLRSSRGNIYDASGELLAQTVNSYTLIAYLSPQRTTDENNPQHVVDKELTAEKLAPILKMEKEEVLKYLNQDGKYQVEFGSKGRNLTENTKSKIVALDLPGLDFLVSSQRYYEKAGLASYIIGYAKTNDEGKITGELGIEKYFDNILAGKDGEKTYQKYTSGNYQIPNTTPIIKEAKNGSDIYLTIDSNIQFIAEKAVDALARNVQNDWMIFTVMDAHTGAIVASATSPSFNPNDTNTLNSYMNPLVSYQYEPGSVMKTFSFASAIEAGKYNGSETYKSGSIKVADVTIRDANRTGWGTISFDTGFAYSSNVAATILSQRLGGSTLRNYYEDLGFGKTTGIELSNEAAGDITFKYDSEVATAAFGQGISVTPIQLLQALSFVTNEGTIIKPYIVDKIVNSKGKVTYEGKREEVKKVFSAETAEKMQDLMHKVVYEGLVTIWQPETVKVIGKTGTAQIPSPNGGYVDGEYENIKSFAGIFPEENPKYIVYVATKRMVAAPRVLGNIVTTAIDEIASYANITAQKSDVDYSKIINLENYISKNKDDSVAKLETLGLKPIVIGDGSYITYQYPLKNSSLMVGDKIYLMTNSLNYTMPNMVGWSMNEVKTYCSLINYKCQLKGNGYVTTQNIAAGTALVRDNTIELELNSLET